MTLNQIAQRYVKIILAVGKHHPNYIDAYYGPISWKDEAIEPLLKLLSKIDILITDIKKFNCFRR